MNKNVVISKENGSAILVFAFRYALGRRTFAPSIVVEELKSNWGVMQEWEKKQIKEEIIRQDSFHSLGDECDEQTWKQVLEWE